jgi:hypothetical protein
VLTSGSQGLGFTQGWKEFTRDHCLMLGHFLVFTYEGHSEFSVAVFSRSGVMDKAALKVQPCKKPIIIQEKEEECVEDADVTDTPEAPANLPPVDGDRRTTRKRVSHVNDIMASDTMRKRHSSVQKKLEEKKRLEATTGTPSVAPTGSESNKGKTHILF